MSTATMAQAGAALFGTGQRATHKPNVALPERMGKSPSLRPLQALVEARMRKVKIEMESRRHSCGAASTSPGKAQLTYFAELFSRAASRLSPLVSRTNMWPRIFGNALAPQVFALPTALQPPLRSGSPRRVEALSRTEISHGSSNDAPRSQSGASPIRMCAQGDILIERVDDVPAAGSETEVVDAKVIILARGELSGHRHRIHGHITLFHASELARDIPKGLYVGHVHVKTGSARLEHEQHDAITLQRGTYRVRRQRRLEPSDTDIVED